MATQTTRSLIGLPMRTFVEIRSLGSSFLKRLKLWPVAPRIFQIAKTDLGVTKLDATVEERAKKLVPNHEKLPEIHLCLLEVADPRCDPRASNHEKPTEFNPSQGPDFALRVPCGGLRWPTE